MDDAVKSETMRRDFTFFEGIEERPRARCAHRGRVAQDAAFGIDPVCDALVPCLQPVSGLPGSRFLASRQAGVSATILGHPPAGSRSIVLRSGTRKTDCAVI